jgi:hypothetical protein
MATKKTTSGKSTKRPTHAKLLATALDEKAKVKQRCAALAEIAENVIADRDTFKSVLALITDPEADSVLRNNAMSTLQAATFDPDAFAPYRTSYLAALRKLRKDGDDEIRKRAFGILARENDADTQAVLLEGLNTPDKALLPPEKALQLLSYDTHAGAYDIARGIVDKAPNPLARREAFRVLAADARSTDLFEKVLRDRNETMPIRQLAASSLNQLAPKRLQATARDISVNTAESDEMRSLGMTAIADFGDIEDIRNDATLKSQVENIVGKPATRGAALGLEASREAAPDSGLRTAAEKLKRRFEAQQR